MVGQVTTCLKDTGIYRGSSNSSYCQEEIIKKSNGLFRVKIRLESYNFQSFLSLEKWLPAAGWAVISYETMNARDDAPSVHSREADKEVWLFFQGVIKELMSLSEEF